MVKGIVLAGGSGTRLYPLTKAMSKQMMPVYDKPLIYYPISVLMLAGIKDILIISTPRDLPIFEELLGDGHSIGVHFEYAVQEEPKGIAEAFIIGEEFIGKDNVALILGDNVFHGQGFAQILKAIPDLLQQGTNVIFGYYVKNPKAYGVVELDRQNRAISIEEKPKNPKSHLAVPGLYFYNSNVVSVAKQLKPSDRGELEITDINRYYMKQNKLKVVKLGRGFAWLDTGTPDSLRKATEFVATYQDRQGLYVACLEEIAYKQGFINKNQLEQLIAPLNHTAYGDYLTELMEEPDGI